MKKPLVNGVGLVEDPSEIPEDAGAMAIGGYVTKSPLTAALEASLLKEWVDEALDAQKEIGSHPPILLAMGPNLDNPEHTTVYCMPLEDFFTCEEGKQALCEIAPAFLQQIDASAYMLISECWSIATENPDEIQSIYEQYGSLSQAPDHLKSEMLLMYSETLTGSKQQSYAITRNSKGEILKTTPHTESENPEISSCRYGGWLEAETLH